MKKHFHWLPFLFLFVLICAAGVSGCTTNTYYVDADYPIPTDKDLEGDTCAETDEGCPGDKPYVQNSNDRI